MFWWGVEVPTSFQSELNQIDFQSELNQTEWAGQKQFLLLAQCVINRPSLVQSDFAMHVDRVDEVAIVADDYHRAGPAL